MPELHNTLIIVISNLTGLLQESDTPVFWRAPTGSTESPESTEGSAPPHWQHSALNTIPGEALSLSTKVIIPGEVAQVSQIQLSGKQHKHLNQVLPYLVEEKLATDIEATHIARGKVEAGKQVTYAAIDQSLFKQLIEVLGQSNITPDSIITDSLCLSADENKLNLLIDGKRSLLRLGQRCALSIDSDNLASTVECLQQQNTFNTVELFTNGPLSSEIALSVQALQTDLGIEISDHSLVKTGDKQPALLGYISQVILSGDAKSVTRDELNLLQGDYAPVRKTTSQNHNWLPLAKTAALLFGLHIFYNLGSGWFLNTQGEDLYQQSETLYRQYFPQDRRIINIRTQTENHLRAQRGSAGDNNNFLTLMSIIGSSWREQKNLSIQQIRFDKNAAKMTLDIQAKAISEIDKLRQALSQQGLTVEVLSANEAQQGIRGRIQITGQG